MERWAVLILLLSALGCRGDPLGKPCEADEDCGPGYDCYPDVCVQVCTKDDECRAGQTCYRYHCIVPAQEHARRSRPTTKRPRAAPPGTGLRQAPPLPNATAAELRALRRELELLRLEQTRLIQMLERMQGTLKTPAKPKRPATPKAAAKGSASAKPAPPKTP